MMVMQSQCIWVLSLNILCQDHYKMPFRYKVYLLVCTFLFSQTGQKCMGIFMSDSEYFLHY